MHMTKVRFPRSISPIDFKFEKINKMGSKVAQSLGYFATVFSSIGECSIGLMRRVLANGPGGQGSILGRVIPKTKKMVLGVALLNTNHYKV